MIFRIILAYLLGSIPFGLLLSEAFGNGKLRESGSKNIGATNVLRTQGKFLGFLTFLLDFLKGALACWLLFTEDINTNLFIIAAPVIGHMFPIWLKFKGGKGIATYFGVLLAIDPIVFFSTVSVWILVFLAMRISSLAGILSSASSLLMYSVLKYISHQEIMPVIAVLSDLVIIILIKHKANIIRLLKNEEAALCKTNS